MKIIDLTLLKNTFTENDVFAIFRTVSMVKDKESKC